jgi:Na+/proline symporter
MDLLWFCGKSSYQWFRIFNDIYRAKYYRTLWWVILRKIIRICKVQRISSIADFISSRYGKSVTLGSVVAIFCLLGIIPYISLQIKAVSFSVDILHHSALSPFVGDIPFYQDTAFYISIGLAHFLRFYLEQET